MVAANGEEEKTKWLEDLSTAINQAKTRPDDAFHYLSLKSISKLINISLLFFAAPTDVCGDSYIFMNNVKESYLSRNFFGLWF